MPFPTARRLGLCLLLTPVALGQAGAAPVTDTGNVAVLATASGFVEIAAGGPAALSGSSGGSIANNKVVGSPLTGLTINLGEVGPINPSPFVKVTVPVRLRSNADHVLSMQATQLAPANPSALSSADIGFGLGNISRSGPNVVPGADTPAANVLGDPTLAPDANPATARWDYPNGKRLSDYATATSILSGTRIMAPVPTSAPGGLILAAFFCVKPQFFATGSFSTTITFTIGTP